MIVKPPSFGWRQFKIVGGEFQLNGKKIQCFGDIQHPFSAYICSRRFAYAWYQMIKDFGGNAVVHTHNIGHASIMTWQTKWD